MVSEPKRNVKRAVDRNRLKRQKRESYRLNKLPLAALPTKYAIAYIYTFKEIIPYKDLENKLIESLSRLLNELSKKNEN
jgi:ribonuclease P protein component